MTGRTHDLAAVTVLGYILLSLPLHPLALSTGLVAFTANLIGGVAPDIDQPTAVIWHRIPAGSIIGRILHPLFGGHRFISHSLIGMLLFGFVLKVFLTAAHSVVLVDMDVVWWSFMIGFVSHLLMDTLTKDGVPWLFPIPIKFGFPPIRFLRISTGGIVEKSFVFPMLLIANVYLYSTHYKIVLDLLRHYIK